MSLLSLFFSALTISYIAAQSDDWCQDNAAGRRCALWKIRGLCKSSLPRVKAMMRGMCYETCNLCEPPSLEVCYNSKHQVSAYGCCWDGIIAATGPGGQGCPACEDRMSRKFCSMMKDICFTRENHKVLQANCPATCGYCMKAPHPCRDESGQEIACQNDCYDLDPKELCERRQWTGYCKVQRWQNYLKKRCAWTCGFCGTKQCRDMLPTRVCSLWQARNRCTNPHPAWRRFMKQNCRLTCGLCIEDRFDLQKRRAFTLA